MAAPHSPSLLSDSVRVIYAVYIVAEPGFEPDTSASLADPQVLQRPTRAAVSGFPVGACLSLCAYLLPRQPFHRYSGSYQFVGVGLVSRRLSGTKPPSEHKPPHFVWLYRTARLEKVPQMNILHPRMSIQPGGATTHPRCSVIRCPTLDSV